jgi:hypothetical protein
MKKSELIEPISSQNPLKLRSVDNSCLAGQLRLGPLYCCAAPKGGSIMAKRKKQVGRRNVSNTYAPLSLLLPITFLFSATLFFSNNEPIRTNPVPLPRL